MNTVEESSRQQWCFWEVDKLPFVVEGSNFFSLVGVWVLGFFPACLGANQIIFVSNNLGGGGRHSLHISTLLEKFL